MKHLFAVRTMKAARGPRGFTLLELVISMIVVSMIVLAVGSAITVSLRAAENSRNVNTAAAGATLGQGALEQFQSDLKVATAITSSSATGLTLTVPDRDGDGKAEQIVYSWAGVGSPLLRSYNGSTAVSIADNVQNFALGYYTRTVGSAATSETAEQTLIAQNSLLFSASALTSTSWAAEYFKPTLPSNAVAWKITHVQVSFSGKSSANLTARIQPADAASLPMSTALGSVAVSASTLPLLGSGTLDFKFATPISGLSPLQGYCLVITSNGSGTGVNKAVISLTSGMSWTTTSNSGSSWAAVSGLTAMQFTVYGTVTTQ
jgi:prepilin-type N-terminal cleavage/methylation domain-containing protein